LTALTQIGEDSPALQKTLNCDLSIPENATAAIGTIARKCRRFFILIPFKTEIRRRVTRHCKKKTPYPKEEKV